MPKRFRNEDHVPETVKTDLLKDVQKRFVRLPIPYTPPCLVYFLFHNDELVYVGKTYGVFARIESHKKDKIFDDIYYVAVEPEQLGKVEEAFIHYYKPKYNKQRLPENGIRVER